MCLPSKWKLIAHLLQRQSYDTENIGKLYEKLFADVNDQPIGAVCFDVDLDFNLGKFYLAEYFLNQNPECLFLVGGTDENYFINDYSFAGNGCWVEVLKKRCPNSKPIGLGKPGDVLGDLIMEKFQIKDKSRVLFVGDTLEQDIGFAHKNGFQTLLVLSGITSRKMLFSHEKVDEIPDYYAKSLHDFVQFYRELFESNL